MFYTGKLVHI